VLREVRVVAEEVEVRPVVLRYMQVDLKDTTLALHKIFQILLQQEMLRYMEEMVVPDK
jgi:hypothetical protein